MFAIACMWSHMCFWVWPQVVRHGSTEPCELFITLDYKSNIRVSNAHTLSTSRLHFWHRNREEERAGWQPPLFPVFVRWFLLPPFPLLCWDMGDLCTASQTCFFVFSDRNHTHNVSTVLQHSPLLRKVREAKTRFSVSCRIVISRSSNLGQLSSFLSSICNSVKVEPSLTSVFRAQARDIYPSPQKRSVLGCVLSSFFIMPWDGGSRSCLLSL